MPPVLSLPAAVLSVFLSCEVPSLLLLRLFRRAAAVMAARRGRLCIRRLCLRLLCRVLAVRTAAVSAAAAASCALLRLVLGLIAVQQALTARGECGLDLAADALGGLVAQRISARGRMRVKARLVLLEACVRVAAAVRGAGRTGRG